MGQRPPVKGEAAAAAAAATTTAKATAGSGAERGGKGVGSPAKALLLRGPVFISVVLCSLLCF